MRRKIHNYMPDHVTTKTNWIQKLCSEIVKMNQKHEIIMGKRLL